MAKTDVKRNLLSDVCNTSDYSLGPLSVVSDLTVEYF